MNSFETGKITPAELNTGNDNEAVSPSGVTCVELITSDSDQIQDFNRKVQAINGILPVMVHPFFSDNPSRLATDHRFVTSEYLARRDRYLGACIKDDLPLVIFEQEDDFTKLPRRLEKFGTGTIYTVQTENNYPRALGGQSDWEKLIDILKHGGVELVILGGMYLTNFKSEIAPYMEPGEFVKKFTAKMKSYEEKYPKAARWLKKDLVPLGCVGGAAIHFLDAGIDVTLSTVATPSIGTSYFPMKLVPNDEDW